MAFIYQTAIHSTPRLKSLLVTSQPAKINYASGEVFDPTGMAITAIYTNGSTKTITDYTYSPTRPLNENDTEITVSYTEKGITKTTIITISVESVLSSIAVTKMPNKTVYLYKDSLSTAGMEVTATFSNGSQRTVSGWTVDTTTLTTLGSNTITVSYSTGGITKTTTMTVTVNAITLIVPSQSNNLVYNGQSQSPTWNNYNSSQLTIGGTTSGVNASGYTATFTPEYGYMWSGGVTTAKSVNWQINRVTITTVPSQSGTLTYSGRSQSPTWNNYNSSQLTIGGTTSSTNAGTYTATFTPTSNYMWSGGVTTAKSVNWQIDKARRALTITAVSGVTVTNNNRLSISSATSIIDIAYTGPNAGLVTSSLPNGTSIISKTNSATTSSANITRMTITAVANGSTNLNLIVGEGLDGNYDTTYYLVSCTVNMPIIKEITDSWDTISARTTAGTAANYYSIGSYKTIRLNGYYGVYTHNYSNLPETKIDVTMQAFIIGINHNPENSIPVFMSSKPNEDVSQKKLIHWQLGKINNKQVALSDHRYSSISYNGNPTPFAMQVHSSNDKYINTFFPGSMIYSFLNESTTDTVSGLIGYDGISFYLYWVLPDDLKQVLVSTSISFYNVHTSTKASFQAKMTLPSAREIADVDYYSSDLYDQQYEYYANGNSAVFHSIDNNNNTLSYWLRSKDAAYSSHWACYNSNGDFISHTGDISLAICPIFFT